MSERYERQSDDSDGEGLDDGAGAGCADEAGTDAGDADAPGKVWPSARVSLSSLIVLFDPSGAAAQNVKRRGLRTSNDGHTGREGKLLSRRPGDKRDYLTFAPAERLDAFVPV